MLAKVKQALRISSTVSTAFDGEINDLINAAVADLQVTGAVIPGAENPQTITDPLVIRAIITYCRVNFGEPDDYDRMKASYDEQKAQIRQNPNYAEDIDG